MLKRLIILTLIDIIVIGLWDYWVKSTRVDQEGAIGVIFVVPAIIVASGLVGFVMKLKRSVWANAILVNIFIAFIIFIGVFNYEFWKQQHDNYLTYYFSDNGKIYNVTLILNKAQLQNGLDYNIYERLGEYGNAGTGLDGSYTKKNDTIILTSEKGKVMKIFGSTLFDYPQKGQFVALRTNPE